MKLPSRFIFREFKQNDHCCYYYYYYYYYYYCHFYYYYYYARLRARRLHARRQCARRRCDRRRLAARIAHVSAVDVRPGKRTAADRIARARARHRRG